MQYHDLVASQKGHLESDDLGLEVSRTGGHVVVCVPTEVAAALGRLGVRNAEELAAALNSFPTEVARELSLDVGVVLHARQSIFNKLRGIVEDVFLRPPEQRWIYGAFRPGQH